MFGYRGFTLLEVLITLIILAIGLLGLANLQTKMQTTQVESYQRAQAVLLMQDMANRISANRENAALYAGDTVYGTGKTDDALCAEATTLLQDLCEWSNAIKGASEQLGGANTGAMIGGRGCITEEQVANPVTGFCAPGIYRVSVAWQGLSATVAPAIDCGENLYGTDDRLRRVVSVQTVISEPGC